MLREDLGRIVTCAIDRLIESGALPEAARGPVEIIDTKQPEHGDYATNFALTASKKACINPRELAEKLQTAILEVDAAGVGEVNPQARKMVSEGSPPRADRRQPLIHKIDIAGPGFLNFRLKAEAVASYVATILELGEDLPKSKIQNPKSINVEFVSVNPNGPITVGSARGAAFGDTLCRVLEATGNTVNREYYINDGVNSEQMRLFAESVRHYYREGSGHESTFPEKGYRGDYVQDVANHLQELHPGVHESPTGWFQARSQELMLQRQREDLHTFGVDFDTWFSEQTLHDSGVVARCIDDLIAKGAADEEPSRTVLKMARGGVIEEVKKEPQTDQMEEEEEHAEEVTGTAGVPPAPEPNASSLTRDEPHGRGGSTLWLRSTKFGDDMDRVLRRRDGRLTYIASDVAYHKDKLTDESGIRGTGPADKLITILGPDHHGYIHRLQAVLAALLENPGAEHGTPNTEPLDEIERDIYRSPEERDAAKAALEDARRKLEVVIFQIVRFVKDGKPAPMRKRDGNIYELRDLIDEVGQTLAASATKEEQQRIGADVARFFYLMRSHDTHMDFDIDLATKQSDENPVFYVQYAHARICSVLRKAQDTAGIWGIEAGRASGGATLTEATPASHPGNTPIPQHLNTSLLSHPREQSLIKKILDLPLEVSRCAEDYGVHRLTTYAIELARTYHHFYDACRVIQPDQPELSQARLALCEAARIALKSSLDLIGVSAPERMEREEPAA